MRKGRTLQIAQHAVLYAEVLNSASHLIHQERKREQGKEDDLLASSTIADLDEMVRETAPEIAAKQAFLDALTDEEKRRLLVILCAGRYHPEDTFSQWLEEIRRESPERVDQLLRERAAAWNKHVPAGLAKAEAEGFDLDADWGF